MSGSMASVSIVGRLTRDAELKYIPSGMAVLHFSIATSDRSKKGAEWIDEPSFWDCELWGKQAESIGKYMLKGKLIALSGSMKTDSWEKDGVKKSKVKITSQSIFLLSSGDHQDKHQDEHQDKPEAPADSFQDDIPF